MHAFDTIYAPSTPLGGAIAILRISGPGCLNALKILTQKAEFPARAMVRAGLTYHGRLMDDALAVYFPSPFSYTGEDMAELHCHGSPAVMRMVMQTLSEIGLRPAQAGEFTQRAFLNGKMDLTQAESVMDLLQAEAVQAAQAALEQMQGRLRDDILHIESLLIDGLTALSATLDYPDEVGEEALEQLCAQLREAHALLNKLVEDGKRGRLLREGFRVALIGAPNAGKSSLLNSLLGRDRAIVTAQPGTTRDVLEETLLLEGLPVRLFDTAGMRDAQDEAEQQGVARARAVLREADAALLLLDGAIPFDQAALLSMLPDDIPTILLQTKSDLPLAWDCQSLSALLPRDLPVLPISVKTGAGLAEIRRMLVDMAGPVGASYVTNRRHIDALIVAERAVGQAMGAVDLDCITTDIREALLELGSITGKNVDAEILQAIFENFCVGK